MNMIIDAVIKKNLTYLSKKDLENLTKYVNKTKKLKGIAIEAGCALGGSAMVIAEQLKGQKDFYIYDVFDMIPPPGEKDGADVKERYNVISSGKSAGIGDDVYYGYKENLLEEVQLRFKEYGLLSDRIHFIKGKYEETLIINEPVAFAHIDCDWYSSVITCLSQIVPNLVSKGCLVIDDYNAWSGCKTAVDEYFSGQVNKKDYTFINKNKLVIIKK